MKVLACGVCHGDGLVKNGGSYPGLEYPRIPGHEIIGVIEKIGPGVRGLEYNLDGLGLSSLQTNFQMISFQES